MNPLSSWKLESKFTMVPSSHTIVALQTERHPRKSGPRPGTSIAEFDALFPDDAACEQHIFRTRYGHLTCCPYCDLNTSWWKHPKRAIYVCTRCRRHLNLKSQTLFHATRIPLKVLFYAMLLSANSVATPPNSVLRRHLGFSTSSALAFGRKFRAHLTTIENKRKIGGAGYPVHVEIFYFKGLYSVISKGKKRAAVLVLSDGSASTVSILDTTRPARIFEAIRQKVAAGSRITANDPALLQKLTLYRQVWFCIERVEDQSAVFVDRHQYETRIFIANAVNAIRKIYIRVSIEWLEQYLGEQMYRFNHRGTSIFMQAISEFPYINESISNSRKI